VPDKTIIDAVHVTEDFSPQVKVNKIATNYYEWLQGISLCLGMAFFYIYCKKRTAQPE
jgi:hypothetical protein